MVVKNKAQRDDEHDRLMSVIFGNEETGDIGMKEKVDEIHQLLIQAKNVGGFFGGVKSLMGWMLVLGLFVALAKGWVSTFITFLDRTS